MRENNQEKYPGRANEISITTSGIFKIGRVKTRRKRYNGESCNEFFDNVVSS